MEEKALEAIIETFHMTEGWCYTLCDANYYFTIDLI